LLNRAFFNDLPNNSQQVNCYIQQPVMYQQHSDIITNNNNNNGLTAKNNIQFTSSTLPPIRYLQHANIVQQQQQQQQNNNNNNNNQHHEISNIYKNSIRIMTPAGQFQDAKILMTSMNNMQHQMHPSFTTSHLQNQNQHQNQDFFVNSKQQRNGSINMNNSSINLILPNIDISFLETNK
jgi:hypothetical protein